jgi:hypothetical protein
MRLPERRRRHDNHVSSLISPPLDCSNSGKLPRPRLCELTPGGGAQYLRNQWDLQTTPVPKPTSRSTACQNMNQHVGAMNDLPGIGKSHGGTKYLGGAYRKRRRRGTPYATFGKGGRVWRLLNRAVSACSYSTTIQVPIGSCCSRPGFDQSHTPDGKTARRRAHCVGVKLMA